MADKFGGPAFVGEFWLQPGQGYSYESTPPPGLNSPEALRSSNGWTQFLAVFERAKAGDMSGLALLPRLITASEDIYLDSAAINLLGAAGSDELLVQLIPLMSHPAYTVRLDAYAAANLSGRLFLVEPMLKAHRQHLSGERGMIENSLSDLLEPEAGLIAEPMQMPRDVYDALVRSTVASVEALCGPGVSVFQGQPLSIERIVNRTMAWVVSRKLAEYAATVADLMHRFETMTGIACVGLFEESGQPLPLNIRLMLQQFVRGGGLTRFPPGVRYFFGCPVPSNSRIR